MIRIVLCFTALVLTACIFEKTVDASNEKTMQLSLKEIMSEMDEKNREYFQQSLTILMFSEANSIADMIAMSNNMDATKAAFLTKIDGKTAKEINMLADNARPNRAEIDDSNITADDIAGSSKRDVAKKAIEAKLISKTTEKVRYQDFITTVIAFKNLSDKDIKGVKGIIAFKDMFGDDILSLNLSLDETIKSGQTFQYVGNIDHNEFIESHNKLASTSFEKLSMEFIPKIILFEDGSEIKAE